MKIKLPRFLRNKYILATTVFVLWVCFFNDIDLFYVIKSRQEVSALKKEVELLKEKNSSSDIALHDLTTNRNSLEKFARETYYMKRPNEDVFVFKQRSN